MAQRLILEREPALVWRRPAALWVLGALILGLGAPAFILRGEGGMAQLMLITGGIGFAAALFSLIAASALGRAPRSRREVMIHTLWLGILAALAAPFAFQLLLHAMEGIEAPHGPVGLSAFLPFALWPLSLFLGLPLALFSGLVLSFVAFRREREADHVVTLTHATDPAFAPQRDDASVF